MTITVAQRNFLALHAGHVVDRWQWHFCGVQLRAHAGSHQATIWKDELDDLVRWGLMAPGHASDVKITDAGVEHVTQQTEQKEAAE